MMHDAGGLLKAVKTNHEGHEEKIQEEHEARVGVGSDMPRPTAKTSQSCMHD